MKSRRGMVLGFAVILGVIGAIAAYGMLILVMSMARQTGVFQNRTAARYAAEAGLVIAQQKLWENPGYCGGIETVETDVGNVPVQVTVSDCNPTNPKEIIVTAVYR